MNTTMKILIAYDGAHCSDAAVEDLRRAGLPHEANAVVLSVANVLLLPTSPAREQRAQTALDERAAAARQRAREQARQAVGEAHRLAQTATARVQAYFPLWNVQAEACADAPAWAVIKKADAWQSDLIVVGSHGRSAFGRFLFGSVPQTVLTAARCTVRVARGRGEDRSAPVRIIIGVDGSPNANATVRTVAERVWPPGSEARVIAVLDSVRLAAAEGDKERHTAEQIWARRLAETAAEQLRAAGLTVSSVVQEGDPKRVLVEEAEQWGADCLFVGARGFSRLERFLRGRVSTAIAVHAPCSVELVH